MGRTIMDLLRGGRRARGGRPSFRLAIPGEGSGPGGGT